MIELELNIFALCAGNDTNFPSAVQLTKIKFNDRGEILFLTEDDSKKWQLLKTLFLFERLHVGDLPKDWWAKPEFYRGSDHDLRRALKASDRVVHNAPT